MLSSIRRIFVLYAIFAVTSVVVCVCTIMNYFNYSKIDQRTTNILETLTNNKVVFNQLLGSNGSNLQNLDENSVTTSEFRGIISEDNTFFSGFTIVSIDSDNKIKYYNDDRSIKDTSEISEMVNSAYNSDKDSAFLGNRKYLKLEKQGDRTIILFVNSQRELEVYYSFLKNSILVSLLVILGVAVIAALISNKVVMPIKQSYIKQKQFITDASHELKTPLTIIRSNTDVLELENGNSKWTKNIQNQVDRLTSLVNSLVVFSRMEEKDTIDKSKFSLTDAVNSRIEDFEELANFQNKDFKINIEENISYFGDKQGIVQVIDILLDNAIKYAPKGTFINIELKRVRKHAIFKIYNDANVEKGDLSKVFDRFYRLDESRNSDVKGYGIGLSLAKVIIEKHKEHISAYSPENGVFVIEIKLTLDDNRLNK